MGKEDGTQYGESSLVRRRGILRPATSSKNLDLMIEGLYLACENLVNETPTIGVAKKEMNFHKKSVQSLTELAGAYDAVIICLGGGAAFLPELIEKLPLRMCRGVIAHLQLDKDIRGVYLDNCPSILSDAWLSIKGGRHLDLASAWTGNRIISLEKLR